MQKNDNGNKRTRGRGRRLGIRRSLGLLCIPCYSHSAAAAAGFLPPMITAGTNNGSRMDRTAALIRPPSQRRMAQAIYLNAATRKSSRSSSASSSSSREPSSKRVKLRVNKNNKTDNEQQQSSAIANNKQQNSNSNQNNNNNNYRTPKTKQKNFDPTRSDAGAWYQREEMLKHEILSKDDEIELGNTIIAAKKLRDDLTALVEEIKLERYENFNKMNEEGVGGGGGIWEDDAWLMAMDADGSIMGMGSNNNNEDDDNELDCLSIYDNIQGTNGNANGSGNVMMVGFNEECTVDSWEHFDFAGDKRISSTLVQDGSKLSLTALDADLLLVTDDDIRNRMGYSGGRDELRCQLALGAEARVILMRSNIRLVVSISKKWMGRSFSGGNSSGRTSVLYNGGWDKPSLDEVIQEGVLGLARAVDKYDPDRGLRFSTYSTHWITSYVRQCLQEASTGCLKVPAQLHEIKNSYKSLIKKYVDLYEPIPPEDEVAKQLGVTVSRLRASIRATEGLLSIDEPVYNGGNAAFKGSGAGGDNSGESALLLMDRLECTEIAPEDFVEISFLRQTLESAMAAELSPHERDILRLRLGLDDGQTRTVRQVVEECGGGITVSDVRSAERRAFKKLRSPNSLYTHNLLEYFDIAGIDGGHR